MAANGNGDPKHRAMTEAIVCGAGTAGLASAAALRAVGVDATVLEQTDKVGASWRTRYDGLRLNTTGWMSTQPGYRASSSPLWWSSHPVTRGSSTSRITPLTIASTFALAHRYDALEPVDGDWRIQTNGEGLRGRFVVVATGFDHDPDLPDWPGRDGFAGELIHSSAYRNPKPYSGRDVLVVGPDTTGSEVAALLSRGGAGRVRVACRTTPNLITRKFLGVSTNIPGLALNHLPLSVADQISWLGQRNGLRQPRQLRASAFTRRGCHDDAATETGTGLRQWVRVPPQGRTDRGRCRCGRL